ncbi:uncharacterized protein LOC123693786 isoform X2 [Colias croceus]|uniref:uncharacterized protein LOC123693786 isoform X2 n=1 Tax=Colias crocea TaxID=72248 RepID=UPI001E27AA7D|nr:uncharacterized protein LOC123693786 isoform X2 [Colias croceus]
MYIVYIFILLLYICKGSFSLLCFNCSSTYRDTPGCAGDFAKPFIGFNSTRYLLINCTGDNTMCFVRSWTARARHAWIVQRGCYETSKDDFFPRTMTIPTRAMACKHERLPDAEYKVCFCQADWCNTGTTTYGFQIALSISIVSLLIYYTSIKEQP